MVVGGEVVDDLDEEALEVDGADSVVDDLVVVEQVENGKKSDFQKSSQLFFFFSSLFLKETYLNKVSRYFRIKNADAFFEFPAIIWYDGEV